VNQLQQQTPVNAALPREGRSKQYENEIDPFRAHAPEITPAAKPGRVKKRKPDPLNQNRGPASSASIYLACSDHGVKTLVRLLHRLRFFELRVVLQDGKGKEPQRQTVQKYLSNSNGRKTRNERGSPTNGTQGRQSKTAKRNAITGTQHSSR